MQNVERTRTRLRLVLFAAVALMSTGYIAAVTVSTLAARDITGSSLLVGVPASVGTISTAIGTATLGRTVVRAGRRRALLIGTSVAAAGGTIAFLGVTSASFVVLVVGMGVLGFGHAASHLARYSAADLVEPQRRGSAVSVVVWASTIGAVFGPRLLDPAGRVAVDLGSVQYGGGFLTAVVFMAAATVLYLVALRPDPSSVALVEAVTPVPVVAERPPFGRPAVQLAIVAMVTGHFVMVLIMTATPIHVENGGHGLAMVGNIISVHTLGMFAFAPIVGRLTDRFGPFRLMAASAITLVTAGLIAAGASPHATVTLGLGLFLLGIGWNFGFVAGSTMLSLAVETESRPLVQGRVDSMVWGAGALATFGSGLLLEGPGYSFTAYLGTGLVGLLVVALVTSRPRVAMAT